MRCRICLSLVLLFAVYLAVTKAASAAEFYQVGFRTLGQWRLEDKLRLDVNIWYPSTRPPRILSYAPWEIAAAPEGRPVEGRFPLILLSHDSDGTRFSYHNTAAWLASRGFVVAAVTHSADCMYNMDALLSLAQLQTRVREISATIDLLLESPQVAQSIDGNRIGIIGFGAGGATSLLLGGALPDCASWPSYCTRVGNNDYYCTPWAKSRLNALCADLPMEQSPADPRIKAVAAVAPGLSMIFGPTSFRHFYPPVLLLGAEKDRIHPPAQHADVLVEFLKNKQIRHVILKKADAASFVAPCPKSIEDELPELCRSVTLAERNAVHRQLHELLLDFFLHYLGNSKNLPHIPAPPEIKKREEEIPVFSPPPPSAMDKRRPKKSR